MKKTTLIYLILGMLFFSTQQSFGQLACNPGEVKYDQVIEYSDAIGNFTTAPTFNFPVCSGWNITAIQITVMARGDLDSSPGSEGNESWLITTENNAVPVSIGNTGVAADECNTLLTSPVTGLSTAQANNWSANNVITFVGNQTGNVGGFCSNDLVSVRLEMCYSVCAPPNAICANPTVSLNAAGMASVTLANINNNSTVGCGNPSFALTGATDFTCAQTGTTQMVTMTVTDNCGNMDNCISTVTIVDDTDPSAICQNITIQLDAAGMASIVPGDIDNGSNDNCGVTLTAAPLTFDCTNVGTNNVVLTATDPSNRTDMCTAVVTVQDIIAPTAVCQNITIQLNGAGNATILPGDVDGGSTDNCPLVLTATPLTFDCTNIGTNNVTLTAADLAGASDMCTAVVTVQDAQAPTAICQNITVQLNAAGMVSIVPNQVNGASTDNCNLTFAATPLDFTCANVGTNNVTLTVTDQGNNMDNCIAVVTVQDVTQPDAICQNITIQLNAAGTASILPTDIDGGSNDECGVTLSATPTTFNCASVGTNNVTLTATDPSNNSDNCTAIVTVQDITPPIAICQDITVQLSSLGTLTIAPSQVDNGSNDACGVTLSATPITFNCTNVGANNVTLTATDPSNNMDDCVAIVTVQDVTPPMALCSNATVTLSATNPGMVTITPAAVDAGSNDACGIATLDLDRTNFTCADVGTPVTVTLTVTDVNNNTATCTAEVNTIDVTPPTPICQPFTAMLDQNGVATVALADVLASASDNCGVQPGGQLTQDVFNCAEIGPNTVTVTVFDVNGLSGSCQTTVTVEDNIAPVAVCQDITIQLDAAGNASITTTDIDGGTSDNCSFTLALNPTTFTCANVGANVVTLTATDPSNNSDFCNGVVTVEDNIAPIANCRNATINLDANGNAVLTTGAINDGSTDACGPLTFDLNQTDFNCDNIGVNPVILTVTDANGNSSTCSADVTVVDPTPAVILCRPSVNTVNDQGVCGAAVLLLPPLVIEENCSIAAVNNTAPAVFPIGTTLVTWTLTDAGGNDSQCLQNVTIHDTEKPEIECGNSFTSYTSWEDCGYPSSFLQGATATDNCGVVSLTNDAPVFFGPGQYMVNYTATDANGNMAMCMQWVKIYDTTLPKLTSCPEDQIVHATTTFGANATWDLPTGMDNCPGAITLIEENGYQPGDFFELGDTQISYRLYDTYGNFVTCEFTISVTSIPQPLTMTCLETIEISTQSDLSLQTIAWNSPLIQSLCEECEVLKSDDGDFEHIGGFEGHNYYLFNADELSWNEAQQIANGLGGYLTIISSDKESLFLSTELADETSVWIGLADQNGDGEANWVDGTDFEIGNWQEAFTFSEEEATGVTLDDEGNWTVESINSTNYFLFEVPCYELAIEMDNDDDNETDFDGVASPNSETVVTYTVTDMCGNALECQFELVFTDENVDYCTEGSIVTDSAAQHFINRLSIGEEFDNESGNDYGYGDFTDEYLELTPGEILDIYADFGPVENDNPLYCRIWIDLNADGDFYDEGELISQAIDILEMEGELTVPNVSTDIEQTRLRIAISRFGYPAPCGTYTNGEMEDYTITFDHEETQFSMQSGNTGSIQNTTATSLKTMAIYPNPANDYVMMQVNDLEGQPATLKVVNTLGMSVYTQSFDELTSEAMQIPLTDFAQGSYYIQLTIEGQVPMIQQFMVEKSKK